MFLLGINDILVLFSWREKREITMLIQRENRRKSGCGSRLLYCLGRVMCREDI
jgi:hypothetical protein